MRWTLSVDQKPLYPLVDPGDIGWLTEAEMVEVDRVMIEDLHIELIQMMENAGRNLARLVLDLHHPSTAWVFAGSGGNGGGGMVAARHLANAGVQVGLSLTREPHELVGAPLHQLDILARMGIVPSSPPPQQADVAIDAIIGYSLRGAPRGTSAQLISEMPTAADAIVSLDTPSGLNVTSGAVPGVAVSADATLTLAAPKSGLRDAASVGELYIADISVPPKVLADLGAKAPNFSGSTILQVLS